MKLLRTLLVASFALSAHPALAQDQQRDDMQAFYVLWGIMEGAAGTCRDIAGGNSAFIEALESWKVRAAGTWDEIDALREGRGLSPAFVEQSVADGSTGISSIISGAPNRDAACQVWLTNVANGWYEPDYYLVEQLGRLRERDGL